MPAVKGLFRQLQTIRRLTAVALMFWCAGAGCLIVSYARSAMIMESSMSAAEEPTAGMSASMDAHACCKAKHKSPKRIRVAMTKVLDRARLEFKNLTLPSPVRNDAMSCCPLTSGSIVAASRSQTNDSNSAIANTGSSSFEPAKADKTPLAIPLRLPNRAHSYLLDCAFLI